MMNQKSREINWKLVWIILLSIIVIGLIIYIITFYKSTTNAKVENEDEIASYILDEKLLSTIEDIQDVQAEERFYIAKGVNDKKEEQLLFIPYKEKIDKKEMKQFHTKELMKEEDIEAMWNENCDGCMLKKSNPSMIDGQPLWELTYFDGAGSYIIQYISLKDGKIYEQLTLNRKYR